ncbi:MAG: hypothetical protein PVF37_06915 [Desulfobacterales bacterium]|jgi:hypothetical protein
MRNKIALGMVICTLILAGCAKEQIYSSSPPLQTVSTSDFEVKLEPLKAEGFNYYNRFRYEFTNKTSGDLIIDWSQTYYLRNGKKYGHFGWEGLTFEHLREVKEEPKITIAPGKKDATEIFPVKLIGWKEEGVRMKATTPEAGFTLTPLPEGENGMSITVLKDGKPLQKKVLLNISLN